MPKTHGVEEYLEAIYVLDAEGHAVLSSRLADFLGVARPTVTQTMQRMTASGFVTAGEGKEIVLTTEGRRRAEQVVRRHRLLERWLTDELGLDWAEAHVEAGRLEHAMSKAVEDRLYEKLGRPTTCPHGNVIPGTGLKQPIGTPLTEIHLPVTVTVLRIVEQAEEDLELLRFLHQSGIVPGAEMKVDASATPFEAGVPVVIGHHRYSLETQVAERIRVVVQ